jgi:hypothetical protein
MDNSHNYFGRKQDIVGGAGGSPQPGSQWGKRGPTITCTQEENPFFMKKNSPLVRH